jgi:anhydro-N-acetylmuramic acid kinase
MHRKGEMGKLERALGLMSGTSMDGIDVALLETDGEHVLQQGPAAGFPYPAEVRAQLRNGLSTARTLQSRNDRPGELATLERRLTELNAEAATRFLSANGIAPGSIDVIGYHGQTVLHDASRAMTVQLGDGGLLAERTGVRVVYDMRAADVAAGGQGAPLVPVYHEALALQLTELPVAFANIGGVGNVTWIGEGGRLIAFDTGPGNALIDDWMMAHSGVAHDDGGATAARGKVDEGVLTALLTHDYFGLPPPKSLDRNAFSLGEVEGLSLEDGAATLTAFTASTMAKAREHMPREPKTWIVCGGGRKNRTLMSMLAEHVHNAVVPVEMLGLDGDFIEAQAWAYLAVRCLRKLPITFPDTTGVSQPMTGGVVVAATS